MSLKNFLSLCKPPIAFDVETSSLDPSKGKIRCFALADSSDPINSIVYRWDNKFIPILNYYFKKSIVIMHNAKFELSYARKYKIKIPNYHDTMIMDYLLENGNYVSHKLEEIAIRYGIKDWGNNVKTLAESVGWDRVPERILIPYNRLDAINTIKIYKYMLRRFDDSLWDLYDLVYSDLPDILLDIENHGVRIDREKLDKFTVSYQYKFDNLKKAVTRRFKKEINLDSPKQVSEELIKLGVPLPRTKKGNYSSAIPVLNGLKNKYPICKILAEIGTTSTFLSSYLLKLPKHIDENNRIHSEFNPCIQVGGRISVVNPNQQNIPKNGRIRQVYIPSEGRKLIQADFKQLEFRIMAYQAKEESLLDSIRKGFDVHAQTSISIFGNNNSENRPIAKRLNFGCIYGITEVGLSKSFNLPIEDTKEILDKFHQIYPNIFNFIEELNAKVALHKVIRNLNGRLLRCNYKNDWEYHKKCKQAGSWTCQSVASDITIWAMKELSKLGYDICLQIHDSVVLDVEEEKIKRAIMDIRNVMSTQATELFKIPLDVEMVIGENL